MSRFSPQVSTPDRSGEIIGAAISQALSGIGQRRQMHRMEAKQDAQTQRQNAIQDAQLGEQGIHLTKPGELPPLFDVNVSGGPNVDGIVSRAITPALMGGATGLAGVSDRATAPTAETPFQATLSRHLDIGPGYYVDRDQQDANAKRSAESQFQSILGAAFAKGKAEDLLDPTARSDRHAVAQSTVERNNRPPAPVAQSHIVDPVTGEVKFFDPTHPPANLRVNPTPTPTQVHAANRVFDVQHPMPTQDNGKMTEFSNKAALVYPRAAEAAQLLEPFFEQGVPANSLLGKVTFGQYGVSPEIQRANQAAETVASAILRLESGAAISVEEARNYARQFLPQPGDSYAVRQQKRAILQTQLERMRQAASPTMRRDTPGDVNLGGDTAGKTITVNGKTFKVPD